VPETIRVSSDGSLQRPFCGVVSTLDIPCDDANSECALALCRAAGYATGAVDGNSTVSASGFCPTTGAQDSRSDEESFGPTTAAAWVSTAGMLGPLGAKAGMVCLVWAQIHSIDTSC